MLKLKNAFMALSMAAAVFASAGLVSCANSSSDDNNETVNLPSSIYGNTYKGTQGVMSATLKVTDSSKIYLVGGPNGSTVIKVEDRAYKTVKAGSVYTVSTKNAASGSDVDFAFTLTINSDGTVTLGYGAMSVVMTKYVAVAEAIAGTYKGKANMAVMTASADFENVSFVITKLTDTTVSLKVPSVTYTAMSKTFPEYTLTNGAVTLADGTYTITFADTTTEADASGNTTAVSSITATVKDNVLTYSASEKYGSMPVAGKFTFTSTSKE